MDRQNYIFFYLYYFTFLLQKELPSLPLFINISSTFHIY